jgi:hypothetical protein
MLLLLSVAFAQDPDTLTDTAAPRVRYQTVTMLEFERVEVGGKLEGPGVSFVTEPPVRTHPSLIRLRASFDDELAQSVHDTR